MTVYYNEFDKRAAAWLRELIKAGEIAPGIVDERSITEVRPSDLKGFAQCHFFAGVGVWSYALRRAGWPDDREVWTGSCPCQPFSNAGAGNGFADERHLWPAFFHLIAQRRPRRVFGEQVASQDGLAWLDRVHADMEAAGYAFGAVDLCAAGVGAPHIRQRLWFVADSASERPPAGPREPGLRPREGQPAGSGRAGRLADDDDDRRGQQWQRGLPEVGIAQPGSDADRRGSIRGLGDTSSSRGRRDARSVPGTQGSPAGRVWCEPHVAVAASHAHRLADSERAGLQAGSEGDLRGALWDDEGRFVVESCDGSVRNVGDAQSRGLGEQRHALVEGGGGHADRPVLALRPGPTNGHWGSVDWIFCRDGKWRPVEPGLEPLVDGAPARVGRLRGYGNAIVAQAAEAFIASYLDVTEQ